MYDRIYNELGIPYFVLEKGNGGRFDVDMAEKYAFRKSELNAFKRYPKEWNMIKLFASSSWNLKDEYQLDLLGTFAKDTVNEVAKYVKRPGAVPGVESEQRTRVFSRYAAFLNFIEARGRKLDNILGADENTLGREDKSDRL